MDHAQSRGKRKTHEVFKKYVHFTKSWGKFAKVGGKYLSRNRGKCSETAKIWGIQNLW